MKGFEIRISGKDSAPSTGRRRLGGGFSALAAVLFLLLPASAPAGSVLDWLNNRETLSGDWGGGGAELAERGIDLEAVYTGEVFANVLGGVHREAVYLDNIDLTLTADAEKLVGWPGVTLFLYGLGNHGENPSANVGDAQGVSNIAAPTTWKLYEAWIQQNLVGEQLSLLAGLYDLNSEFDVLDSANLFLNSSHGIDITFSQSGENGPSIFPVTSLGVRAKWEPQSSFYLQTVLLDGVPGDPDNPHGTQIILKGGDGLLSTTEVGYLYTPGFKASSNRQERYRLGRSEEPDYAGKAALGAWIYTSRFETIRQDPDSGVDRQLSYGLYLIGEYQVYREPGDPVQGLTAFARLGWADPQVNRFDFYAGWGLVYAGLLPGREDDSVGVAVAAAFNGSDYESVAAANGAPAKDAEWNLEATYHARIFPWLDLQPDLQYVIHPDTDPSIPDALALDLRVEISF
jgi:porin